MSRAFSHFILCSVWFPGTNAEVFADAPGVAAFPFELASRFIWVKTIDDTNLSRNKVS